MSLHAAFFSFLSLKGEDFGLYLTPSHVRWERWGVIGSRRCRMSGIKSVCMFVSNALYVLFAALQCWSLFMELFKVFFNVEGTVGIFGIAHYHFYSMQLTVYMQYAKKITNYHNMQDIICMEYCIPQCILMFWVWLFSSSLIGLSISISLGWKKENNYIFFPRKLHLYCT